MRDNLTYTYTYNSHQQLESSADFNGNTTTYAYATPTGNAAVDNRLISITDPLGRALAFSYQADGRASSQTEPGNAVRSFRYGVDGDSAATWVTEIDGTVSEYRFDAGFRTIETTHPDGSMALAAWNSQNEIVSTTDELGFVTQYGYDNDGNVTSIQKPLDASATTIAYNPTFDQPTLLTPLAGAPTQLELNPTTGDVTGISSSSGSATLSLALTYDAFGNRLSVNNGLATYSNQTDANGLLTFVFDARNPETRAYDNRGRLITRTFKSGRVIGYSYDNYDRVTQITDSTGPTLENTYDIVGRLLTRTLSDGKTSETTQFQWDARNRLVSITDPEGNTTMRRYDEPGANGTTIVIDQPVAIVDADGHLTQFQYDSRGRLISQTDANSHTIQYQYNARSDLTALIDPSGQKSAFAYDGNDRLISESRPSLLTNAQGETLATTEVTQYLYDAAGKLIQEQKLSSSGDGNLGVTVLSYDSFDRVIEKVEKLVDASNNLTLQDDSTYQYSPQLDTVQLTSANNPVEKLGFSHEAVPPFATLSYSATSTDPKNALGLVQGSYTVTEDITNQIAGITDSQSHTLFTASYDPAGRLTQIASGNLFSGSSSDSEDSEDSDESIGRILGRKPQAPSLTTALAYDGYGRKTSVTHSTGLTGSFEYDLLNRPTSMEWTQAGTHLWSSSLPLTFEKLRYDPAGDIQSATRPFGEASYSYDPTHQLTGVSVHPGGHDDLRLFAGLDLQGSFTRSFDYDASGNRIRDSLLGAAQYLNDQIIANARATFQSDPNGWGTLSAEIDRVTREEKKYTDRMDGKMIQFTRGRDENLKRDSLRGDPNAQSVSYFSYFYDALGRRVAKSGRLKKRAAFTQGYGYLVDQDKILLAQSGGSELTLYLDGEGTAAGIDEHLGQVSAREALGYATDHLGSVLNSTVAGPFHSFGPWGETLAGWQLGPDGNALPVIYGYAGMEFDPESGVYYDRARIYDPATGRFTTTDPLELIGHDYNLYRYAYNNPQKFVDPAGTDAITVQMPLEGLLGALGFQHTYLVVGQPGSDFLLTQIDFGPQGGQSLANPVGQVDISGVQASEIAGTVTGYIPLTPEQDLNIIISAAQLGAAAANGHYPYSAVPKRVVKRQ